MISQAQTGAAGERIRRYFAVVGETAAGARGPTAADRFGGRGVSADGRSPDGGFRPCSAVIRQPSITL
ncbi:hypothetical protein FRAAL2317 [Frankia alni ACN14a]|uniref:Uncharacterized protein n=1 Tax=Frankia alni (strain DSM 45986 / CECT 9034 / ACN14a) TaxID=326424 RepID=Q0RNC3_FRAAA|nr:hypothetical protein FRAAL2317 [Frankia alni ACN14a]